MPLEKLVSTRSSVGHEQVSDLQRARMLSAMVDVVSEHGASNVTVADVVGRSGVSRRTFYELFEDREDCFLAAFDRAVMRIAREVTPVFEGGGRWRERVRAALIVLLGVLDAEPGIGRLVVVESLGAGPKALRRRGEVLAELIAAVEEGRGEGKAGVAPPSLTAEGLVGGVLSVVHARLLEDPPGGLLELVNQLTSMIVLPYLGSAAARRELDRPVPRPRERSVQASAHDPFRGLHMRFTYRTVRVLAAIAANPGASNRQIGDESGAEDQGQISKLLTRLEGLGLVENSGGGWGRGEPNSWSLTQKGLQVTETIRAHAANNEEVA